MLFWKFRKIPSKSSCPVYTIYNFTKNWSTAKISCECCDNFYCYLESTFGGIAFYTT